MLHAIFNSSIPKFTTIIIQTQAYSQKGNEPDDLEGFDEDFDEESGKEKPASEAMPSKIYLTEEENGEFVKAAEKILKKHNLLFDERYMWG